MDKWRVSQCVYFNNHIICTDKPSCVCSKISKWVTEKCFGFSPIKGTESSVEWRVMDMNLQLGWHTQWNVCCRRGVIIEIHWWLLLLEGVLWPYRVAGRMLHCPSCWGVRRREILVRCCFRTGFLQADNDTMIKRERRRMCESVCVAVFGFNIEWEIKTHHYNDTYRSSTFLSLIFYLFHALMR